MRGKPVEGNAEGPSRRRRVARVAPTVETGAASVSKGGGRSFARTPSQVRIIGGRWKRTVLPVVDAPGLRPSPDRVRETAFNWLAHRLPDFTALRGLDLFAGTGALGLELVSRGAREVMLVEHNARLTDQLERIARKLDAARVRVVCGDALATVRTLGGRTFDVVFLDPPFGSDLLQPALAEAARVISNHGCIYVESGSPLDPARAASLGLAIVRTGRAGQVHFHLLQRA